MIREIKFLLVFIILALHISEASSQNIHVPQPNIQVAYINSLELLELMPGKVAATKAIEDLNNKYKDELTLMQNDYNSKYTSFLSNQNNMAESIKLRRMQELYEMEQNINRFMKIAQEDIESQEKDLIIPLKEKLQEAVNQVGIEQGYICVYDMANSAIAFLTPNAIDATQYVKTKLQIRK